MKRKYWRLICTAILLVPLVACQKEGPFEKAGEKADKTVRTLKNGGKETAGDKLDVAIELDTEPRVVEVPADLAAALKKAKVIEAFDKLSYTHRKEHVRAVNEAKAAETRQRRIDK